MRRTFGTLQAREYYHRAARGTTSLTERRYLETRAARLEPRPAITGATYAVSDQPCTTSVAAGRARAGSRRLRPRARQSSSSKKCRR
jgi:hypothetical protein